jgi:hypothetical protein
MNAAHTCLGTNPSNAEFAALGSSPACIAVPFA